MVSAVKNILISLSVFIIGFSSCQNESVVLNDRVIVAVAEDIESLNPLYSFSGTETNITELLFLSLVQHRWDNIKSKIITYPMIAKDWNWNSDSTELTLNLRDDIFWTDGEQLTTEDIAYSFDLYSDPEVESRLYGTFENFYSDKDGHIDMQRSFEIISQFKLVINFLPASSPDLFDIDIPILPRHIFKKIKRSDLSTSKINLNPVTNGAFKLKSWDRNSSIILAANSSSFLFNNKNINELIFKIIPDYNSRINQLRTGEVDLMEDVKSEDAKNLKNTKGFTIGTIKGRQYDFIGLSNIDNEEYNRTSKIKPHFLFGNREIRRALAMAVNRQEILNEFLGEFGQLAYSPVTNIFNTAHDSSLSPYRYNLTEAKNILSEQGWSDLDQDGVLEKNGVEFSFKLFVPSGNPLREFAGTIIKNNLREAGIEVEIQTMELGVFIENVMTRKIDALMAGWSVPIPIDLKPYWYSDIEESPLNIVGYSNTEADEILNNLEQRMSESKYFQLLYDFEKIMHEDEPVIFLYWIDNVVVYNSIIKNISVDPLGAIHYCWEWQINN